MQFVPKAVKFSVSSCEIEPVFKGISNAGPVVLSWLTRAGLASCWSPIYSSRVAMSLSEPVLMPRSFILLAAADDELVLQDPCPRLHVLSAFIASAAVQLARRRGISTAPTIQPVPENAKPCTAFHGRFLSHMPNIASVQFMCALRVVALNSRT